MVLPLHFNGDDNDAIPVTNLSHEGFLSDDSSRNFGFEVVRGSLYEVVEVAAIQFTFTGKAKRAEGDSFARFLWQICCALYCLLLPESNNPARPKF